MTTNRRTVNAESQLLSASEVRDALGAGVFLEITRGVEKADHFGTVLSAAAVDSAYRSFSGRAITGETSVPIKVGLLSLIFADSSIASRTFAHVAQAAHLKTHLGATQVSVETVTASSGFVSYWAYLLAGSVMAIATLDTFDPARMSMTDFRSLVARLSNHLEQSSDD